jgi:hypothetical protein
MIVELNAEEIRQMVHADNTNPEIPVRVIWEARRSICNADRTFPPDEELPVWYRDHGLDKSSEASTDWVHRHKA